MLAKIECDLLVETLSAHISKLAEIAFSVWFYKKKSYTVFKSASVRNLLFITPNALIPTVIIIDGTFQTETTTL